MKLTMYPYSLNGQAVAPDQFGFTLRPGQGFHAAGVDTIQFWCRGSPPRPRICSVTLTLGEATRADECGIPRWHWDGNMESPTITPSVGCENKCGWHGCITRGDIAP